MINSNSQVNSLLGEPVVNELKSEHKKARQISFYKALRRNKELLLMTLPGVLLIFVLSYLPMFGIIVAFEDYQYDLGLLGSKLIGFTNFRFFFESQFASRILFNTVFLNVLFISTTLIMSVLIAILLNEIKNKLFVKFTQTAMFLPFFLSWVIVGYFAYAIFNPQYGILNNYLSVLGLPPIQWYFHPEYWRGILVSANLWKQIGLNSIIYLAAIINIPQEYYDAAEVDGAGKVKKALYITLPSLVPLISIMLIMSVGGIFRSDFGLFFYITANSSSLYTTTDVLDTFVVRSLRELGDISMGSAAGLFQSVVGFVVVLITNFIVKKVNDDNALF